MSLRFLQPEDSEKLSCLLVHEPPENANRIAKNLYIGLRRKACEELEEDEGYAILWGSFSPVRDPQSIVEPYLSQFQFFMNAANH